jgi:hypothetical protein
LIRAWFVRIRLQPGDEAAQPPWGAGRRSSACAHPAGGLVAAPKGGYSSSMEVLDDGRFTAFYQFADAEAHAMAIEGGSRIMAWVVRACLCPPCSMCSRPSSRCWFRPLQRTVVASWSIALPMQAAVHRVSGFSCHIHSWNATPVACNDLTMLLLSAA